MILNSPTISGSLTVTGNILTSGSITLSGSVASASFAATSSFVALAQSASNAVAAATASSADNLLVRNTLTAQTLVVQTVTSSVIYSSGSNVFGNNIANTQIMTGSVTVTGSLAVVTNGTEFQVTSTGTNFGNALTDSHVISGSLRVNPNGLFVSSSGFVGIGTTSPSTVLHVSGSSSRVALITTSGALSSGFYDGFQMLAANQTGGGLSLNIGKAESTNDLAKMVYFHVSNGSTSNRLGFGFYANDALFNILASGNVGIGTTTPVEKLDVTKNGNQSDVNWGAIMVRNIANYAIGNDASIGFALNNSANTNCDPRASIGCKTESNLGGALVFNTRLDAGTYAERMRITGGGNVGIGTSPSSNFILDVNSTKASGASGIRLSTQSTSAGPILVFNFSPGTLTNWGIGTSQAISNALEFVSSATGGDPSTAGTTRMMVTNSGTVYINSTANLLSNATPQLGILAGATTDAVNIKHTQNGNNTINIWQTGTATHSAMAFYKGDTQNIQGTISVTTSAVTYNSTSDYRLKENVVPLENGLDRLMQLKPSKFNWITTGEEAEGFIAHELQEIFPGAVTGEKDAVYSSTGNIKPQSVDYGRITPLLVKAIQELKAQNDDLQSQINELKAQ
jgi:hypothetical protein